MCLPILAKGFEKGGTPTKHMLVFWGGFLTLESLIESLAASQLNFVGFPLGIFVHILALGGLFVCFIVSRAKWGINCNR